MPGSWGGAHEELSCESVVNQVRYSQGKEKVSESESYPANTEIDSLLSLALSVKG